MKILEGCARDYRSIRAENDDVAIGKVPQNGAVPEKLSTNFLVRVAVLRNVRLMNVKRISRFLAGDWFYR